MRRPPPRRGWGLPVPRLQSRYLQLYTFSTSHFKLINTGLSHSRGHYIISPNINNFYCAHHACHCAWIYMSWSRLALTLHLDCTFHVSPVEKACDKWWDGFWQTNETCVMDCYGARVGTPSGTVHVSVRERLRKPCMFCNCKTSFSRCLEKVRSHHQQGNLYRSRRLSSNR